MDLQPGASQPVKIYTLGRFEILLDGQPLRFVFKTPRKPLALLKGLLCAGVAGIRQEVLTDTLWPDLEAWSAARVLHVTLFRLRALLGRKSAVRVGDGRVTLDPEHCWVDAWTFEHAVAEAKDPTSLLWALRFYRGMFLSDADHPLAYEARERMQRRFHRAVLQLGQSYERMGDTTSAIDLYLMALDADGRSEDVHRALMRCLAREGQSSAVAAAFQRCRATLLRHFGTAPSPLTEQLYRDACGSRPLASAVAAGFVHRAPRLAQGLSPSA